MDVIYNALFEGDMTRQLPQITSFLVWLLKKKLDFFSYLKRSKKIKKIKSRIRKDVIFGNSQVVPPSNRALYITSIGWVNSLNLGVVLISLSLSPLTG